jgi:hypothetical protein
MSNPAENRAQWGQHGAGQLLVDLGVAKQGKEINKLREYERGQKPFNWVNYAATDIPMGKVWETVRTMGQALPVRTSHLGGTWDTISQGGGGEVAFNNNVIRDGVAKPLIFDLNQTPTADRRSGDPLYNPGSVVHNGRMVDLPLYTWNGHEFVQRGRNEALYTPLTLTRINGQLVPLTSLHRGRIKDEVGQNTQFLSTELAANTPLVRSVLTGLLTRSQRAATEFHEFNEATKILGLVSDRTVSLDGIVHRGNVTITRDGKFKIGDKTFSNAADVAELLMIGTNLAAHPQGLNRLQELPHHLPIYSKEMLLALMAITQSDYRQKHSVPPNQPHLHYHMGGLQMAGAPPKISGYFDGSASGVNNLLHFMRVDNADIVPQTLYLLFPAAPHLLLPNRREGADQAAMAQLIAHVNRKTNNDAVRGKPNLVVQQAENAVREWYAQGGADRVSAAWRSRFSQHDNPATAPLPISPEVIVPDDFNKLTFRAASATVAELTKVVK